MTQHPDNVSRSRRAAHGLKAYDPEVAVRDLLTDLMHYCDTHAIDFAYELEVAQRNYVCEVEEPTL